MYHLWGLVYLECLRRCFGCFRSNNGQELIMKNILITSGGRRVSLITAFKKELRRYDIKVNHSS